eukprot:6990096-Heterocapsa_arctica.AAC.1
MGTVPHTASSCGLPGLLITSPITISADPNVLRRVLPLVKTRRSRPTDQIPTDALEYLKVSFMRFAHVSARPQGSKLEIWPRRATFTLKDLASGVGPLGPGDVLLDLARCTDAVRPH